MIAATREQPAPSGMAVGASHGHPRPRVLVIAEAANPEWVSVPLVGWNIAQALCKVADVHVVTHVRNRAALERAGWVHDRHFTTVDNETLSRPLWKLAERVRGGPGVGWTTLAAASWPSYLLFEHLLWRKLGARVRAGEWDLVHRVTPLSPTLPSLVARKLRNAGVPFLVGPLNGGTPWPAQFGQARRAEREWLSYVRGVYRHLPGYRSTREHASALLIASRATWDELPDRWRGRALYLPENGIDPTLFPARQERAISAPLRVIFVGRLVPYKGADMLIDAAAPALRERRIQLEIVGDGPQKAELAGQVRRLGVDHGVTLRGWQTQARVAELLATADLFAFPSIREFGGGVVLEAMASGVPPLVVDYGGPSELVTEATGYKVPLGNRTEIVESLGRILADIVNRPEQLMAKGRAARERVERHFTWPRKAEQLRAVYDWVLGREGKPDFGMPFG
jgi:glycosyltransferase involved in cell wall biosynthesis